MQKKLHMVKKNYTVVKFNRLYQYSRTPIYI